MGALKVFEGWELDATDAEEPRVRDVDMATRAGLAQPRDVRRIIDKNRDELAAHGPLTMRARSARIEKTSGGVVVGHEERAVTEYWLNEAQAVALVARLRTPAALTLRIALVKLFVAYRRGQFAPVAPAAVLPLDVAQGGRLRDDPRILADMKALCGMTARATGRTLPQVYGFVRKTYRVGSPFDVSLLAWDTVKKTLESIALGKLLLPTKARVLRLMAKPQTLPLPLVDQ